MSLTLGLRPGVYLDVPLVTHNQRHFDHIDGLQLVSFG